MSFCPAAFVTTDVQFDADVLLKESWASFLSKWTPEELEWIRKMLEAHPDSVEKFLLVAAGSLSAWLGPIILRWSRDFLVSGILLNNPFFFIFYVPFLFFRRTFVRVSRSRRKSCSVILMKPSRRGVTSCRPSAISRPVILQVSPSLWLLT